MRFITKRVAVIAGPVLLAAGIGAVWFFITRHRPSPEVYAKLKSFVADKEAQAESAVRASGKEMPRTYRSFFAAARSGDWLAISNAFDDLTAITPEERRPGGSDNRLYGTPWQDAIEIWGGFYAFGAGNEKYSATFVREVIGSVPRGGIYFGGNNPGRCLVSAMQQSHLEGEPFFTLTQNSLINGEYLDYLRSMYGDKIVLPTHDDLAKCIADYRADAQSRLAQGKLKPSENVYLNGKGELQFRGSVAVMEVNALLARWVFDHNPNREFHLEQSTPIDWMYPYLEPRGLIFKLNRAPLGELSDNVVNTDQAYWTQEVKPMIGDWLQDRTTVADVATWAERTFARHDFAGLNADPQYIENDYSCRMFGRLRFAIAGLYVWRMKHAGGDAESERMRRAADFAFRQAMALCPYMRDLADAYAGFLKEQNRSSDGNLVLGTADRCYR